MTDMTREELVESLMQKFGLKPGSGGVDLQNNDYAMVVVMDPEEMNEQVISRLQGVKGKKGLKRFVAMPPKATIMNAARTALQGTGIGLIDGRGFIIKPASNTRYRSVTLGTMKK